MSDAPLSLLPFSPEEASRIRRMVLTPGTPLRCPVCDVALTLGPPFPRDGGHVRQVHCPACGRGLMVNDR